MQNNIIEQAVNYFNSLPVSDQIELKKESLQNNISLIDYLLLIFHYDINDNI